MEKIEYVPIGIIHSPFTTIEEMPIQPAGGSAVRGKIILFDEYISALKDLDGFSHVVLLYHFHKVKSWKPLVTPFLDTEQHGLFSTRAPRRPNPIGLSVVKLVEISANTVWVENMDILDGTPLLDIKPYIPTFDEPDEVRIGWLEGHDKAAAAQRSDTRFKD